MSHEPPTGNGPSVSSIEVETALDRETGNQVLSDATDGADPSWQLRWVYLWGLILVVITAGVIWSLFNVDSGYSLITRLNDGDFTSTVVEAYAYTAFGVMALAFAFALSLRLGAPNPGLALVAMAGMVTPGWALGNEPFGVFGWALLAAVISTVFFVGLVVYLGVNSWVAGVTSGAITFGVCWFHAFENSPTWANHEHGYDLNVSIWFLVAGVAAAGLLSTVVAGFFRLRKRFDQVADMVSGDRPHEKKLTVTFAVGTVASSFLAALAPGLALVFSRDPNGVYETHIDGIMERWDNFNGMWVFLLLAIAAVLLAGVSTRRRPGGTAAIVVSSLLITSVIALYDATFWGTSAGRSGEMAYSMLPLGVLLLVGLLVSLGLDRVAQPQSPPADPEPPPDTSGGPQPTVGSDGSLHLGPVTTKSELDLHDAHADGFEFPQLFTWGRVVGNEGVDPVSGANARESVTADLGAVRDDHDLASPSRHERIYSRFAFMMRRGT